MTKTITTTIDKAEKKINWTEYCWTNKNPIENLSFTGMRSSIPAAMSRKQSKKSVDKSELKIIMKNIQN